MAVFDKKIGIVIRQTVDAARTMIFEAATREPYAVGPEGTSQDIAVVAGVGLALKLKADWVAPVNPFSRTRFEATGHWADSFL